MKVLLFLVHPAGFHFVKNAINQLRANGVELKVLIVKKDVLELLVNAQGWAYRNIFPEGRRSPKMPILLSAAINLLRSEIRILREARRFRPDMMVSDDGTVAHIGWFLKIPSVLFTEDDIGTVKEQHLFFPFATKILAPACCNVGRWQEKTLSYKGYHELSYLHPRYFTPNKEVVKSFNPSGERYFILRFAELTASHDIGKKGITPQVAQRIIEKLKAHGKIFITSERILEAEFEQYRLSINPVDIFHALFYADMYIGDSQTVTAEAAVLGTPSIRFNDFVGKLSYLEELEHVYQLTFGIPTSQPRKLYEKIDELLNMPNIKETWQKRREKLIQEKTDVTEFITRQLEWILKGLREK